MKDRQEGFIGLVIVAVVAAASAVGGTAYVEQTRQDNNLNGALNDVRESLLQSRSESNESLPTIVTNNFIILNNDSQYSTFVNLLQSVGLDQEIAQTRYTIFAPTNDAFNALPAGKLDEISKDPAKLKAVLQYHLAIGAHDSRQLANLTTLPTAQGTAVGIAMNDGVIQVNGAPISYIDKKTSNGYIHSIDQVLMPAQ